jgi:hypothetical protein
VDLYPSLKPVRTNGLLIQYRRYLLTACLLLIEIRKQGLQDKLILGERLPDVKTRAIPSLKKNLEALNHTKSKSTEEFDNMINR